MWHSASTFFARRNRIVCMARMFAGLLAGNLDHFGVPALRGRAGAARRTPGGRRQSDRCRRVLPWRLDRAHLGVHREPPSGDRALLRISTEAANGDPSPLSVVGSSPEKDFTTKAASILEAELTAAGTPHDLKVYAGTKHSFFNDTVRNYNADAAADSWRRVLAFFDTHLKASTGNDRSSPDRRGSYRSGDCETRRVGLSGAVARLVSPCCL